MWTLVKPLSAAALKEVENFKSQLEKNGISNLVLRSEQEIDPHQARILTWNSREAERLSRFSHVTVLEPGVDTRLRTVRPEPRPYDVLRVVTCLDIEPNNGFDEALNVFRSLPDLAWHWYIVGEPVDDDYFEQLTEQLDRLGWEDQVTFLGPFPVEERIKLYMNMDLALFPALQETIGFALLENLQMGLPIASTPVSFANELLEGDDEAHIIKDWAAVRTFFERYKGLKETVRKKRDHPLLARKWSQAALELQSLSAEIP